MLRINHIIIIIIIIIGKNYAHEIYKEMMGEEDYNKKMEEANKVCTIHLYWVALAFFLLCPVSSVPFFHLPPYSVSVFFLSINEREKRLRFPYWWRQYAQNSVPHGSLHE